MAAGVAAELILLLVRREHAMYIKKNLAFFLTSVLVILLSLSGSREIMAQEAGLILYLPFDEGKRDMVRVEVGY